MLKRSTVALLLTFLCIAVLFPSLNAQTSDEKPTLKKFGSSLKRIKWDREKQTTVDTETANGGNDADVEDVVRVKTDLVVCDVVVLDQQKRIVKDLQKDDFVVKEDGQLQTLSHFSSGEGDEIGRSIVLIIDYSDSLLPYIKWTVDAAKVLVDKLRARDRMAIVTDDVELLVDFTADKVKLKKGLEALQIRAMNRRGHSDQFTALLATTREMFSEEDLRPIVIFQTDGDEAAFLQPPKLTSPKRRIKQYSLDYIYKAAERSRATVYTIIPGIQVMGIEQRDQLSRAKRSYERTAAASGYSLKRLDDTEAKNWLDFLMRGQVAASGVAKLTGGWTSFLEHPDQASSIYSQILSDIENRYVIGYYPTNKTRDGLRRRLAIQVKDHPEYVVWGRTSYFAPQPDSRP